MSTAAPLDEDIDLDLVEEDLPPSEISDNDGDDETYAADNLGIGENGDSFEVRIEEETFLTCYDARDRLFEIARSPGRSFGFVVRSSKEDKDYIYFSCDRFRPAKKDSGPMKRKKTWKGCGCRWAASLKCNVDGSFTLRKRT